MEVNVSFRVCHSVPLSLCRQRYLSNLRKPENDDQHSESNPESPASEASSSSSSSRSGVASVGSGRDLDAADVRSELPAGTASVQLEPAEGEESAGPASFPNDSSGPSGLPLGARETPEETDLQIVNVISMTAGEPEIRYDCECIATVSLMRKIGTEVLEFVYDETFVQFVSNRRRKKKKRKKIQQQPEAVVSTMETEESVEKKTEEVASNTPDIHSALSLGTNYLANKPVREETNDNTEKEIVEDKKMTATKEQEETKDQKSEETGEERKELKKSEIGKMDDPNNKTEGVGDLVKQENVEVAQQASSKEANFPDDKTKGGSDSVKQKNVEIAQQASSKEEAKENKKETGNTERAGEQSSQTKPTAGPSKNVLSNVSSEPERILRRSPRKRPAQVNKAAIPSTSQPKVLQHLDSVSPCFDGRKANQKHQVKQIEKVNSDIDSTRQKNKGVSCKKLTQQKVHDSGANTAVMPKKTVQDLGNTSSETIAESLKKRDSKETRGNVEKREEPSLQQKADESSPDIAAVPKKTVQDIKTDNSETIRGNVETREEPSSQEEQKSIKKTGKETKGEHPTGRLCDGLPKPEARSRLDGLQRHCKTGASTAEPEQSPSKKRKILETEEPAPSKGRSAKRKATVAFEGKCQTDVKGEKLLAPVEEDPIITFSKRSRHNTGQIKVKSEPESDICTKDGVGHFAETGVKFNNSQVVHEEPKERTAKNVPATSAPDKSGHKCSKCGRVSCFLVFP